MGRTALEQQKKREIWQILFCREFPLATTGDAGKCVQINVWGGGGVDEYRAQMTRRPPSRDIIEALNKIRTKDMRYI
jgi:hypothetical protein